jgi:uncharacterized Zn finger protein
VSPSDFHDQHGGDRFPPPSAPRKVTGGIRLQARGARAVGTNWWARRWLASLEALGIGERLERGRAYARGGQVVSLTVELGSIDAVVQGTRLAPYDARISAKAFTQLEWLALATAFAQRAGSRAQLLAGELPDDAEAVFARAGLKLFPSVDDDLAFSCSCADWASPCRHVAAVCYLVAEAFDRDPFLIFRLRGIERELLLSLVQAHDEMPAASVESTGASATDAAPDAATDAPTSPTAEPASPVAAPYLDLTPPPADAPLVRALGPIPFWRGSDDFEPTMMRMYARVASDPLVLDVALGVWPVATGLRAELRP